MVGVGSTLGSEARRLRRGPRVRSPSSSAARAVLMVRFPRGGAHSRRPLHAGRHPQEPGGGKSVAVLPAPLKLWGGAAFPEA